MRKTKEQALKMINKGHSRIGMGIYLLYFNPILNNWRYSPIASLNDLPASHWYTQFWNGLSISEKTQYLNERKNFFNV